MKKSVCTKTFYPGYDDGFKGEYRYHIWEGSATDAGFLMEFFLDGMSNNPERTARVLESIQRNAPFATNMFDCEFEDDNALLGYEYAPEEPPCLIIPKKNLLDGIKQWIWAYGEDKNRIVLELSDDYKIRVYAEDAPTKNLAGEDVLD